MLLKVSERIALLSVLPAQGNYETLKIVADLQTVLAFKEGELEQFEIKQTDTKTSWGKDEEAEIEMSNKQMGLACAALSEKDKASLLTPLHVSVYEKFMEWQG